MISIDAIALLSGTGAGLVKMLVTDWHERQKLMMRLKFDDIRDAREVTNPFMQYTRRVIALMLVGVLVFYPVLAAICHWPLYVPYLQTRGGLSSLLLGNAHMAWIKLPNGLVFLPMMIPSILYVVGFYFGSGGTRP